MCLALGCIFKTTHRKDRRHPKLNHSLFDFSCLSSVITSSFLWMYLYEDNGTQYQIIQHLFQVLDSVESSTLVPELTLSHWQRWQKEVFLRSAPWWALTDTPWDQLAPLKDSLHRNMFSESLIHSLSMDESSSHPYWKFSFAFLHPNPWPRPCDCCSYFCLAFQRQTSESYCVSHPSYVSTVECGQMTD